MDTMKRKVALVTGGSRGLGREISLALARDGIDVILTFRSNQRGASEVVSEIEREGGKAVALSLDLSDPSLLDSFMERLSQTLQDIWAQEGLDFVIQNAGFGATLPIADVTEEDFDGLMNVHLKGVLFLTQKALPLLNDHGALVFMSSGSARFHVPGYAVYASLKAAVEVFARYVAREYGARGIRSNVVAPGAIETDFNGAAIRNSPRMKEFIAGQTALGRVGQADDVGSVVSFLCSDAARWISGERIEISGGMYL